MFTFTEINLCQNYLINLLIILFNKSYDHLTAHYEF